MKNKPAFPSRERVIIKLADGKYTDAKINKLDGMTLREYTAIKIAAALAPTWIAIDTVTHKLIGDDGVVTIAVQLTDKLLNELEK